MTCNKCTKVSGALMLLFGILFLVKDVSGWAMWGVQWWTVVFLLFGLGSICKGGCPDCQAECCETTKSSKKR